LSYVRCQRRHSQQQTETAADADEPVPLKAVSNSSVSGNEMISASSNGAAIACDSSVQVLVSGNGSAANSANSVSQ